MPCPNFASTVSRSQSMVTALGRIRILRTRSELAGSKCLTGSFPRAPGSGCTAPKMARPASMTMSRRGALTGSALIFSGGICFGPVRGAWPEGPDEWKGWWGDEPPYHTPVFVLTHYPRAALKMAGGTTFHFVTDGIYSDLKQA